MFSLFTGPASPMPPTQTKTGQDEPTTILVSILRYNLRSFLAILLMFPLNRPPKSFIFLRKSYHAALHTEVQSKVIFSDPSQCSRSTDHRNPLLSYGNPTILLSILRCNLRSCSAIPPSAPAQLIALITEIFNFPLEIQPFCSPH